MSALQKILTKAFVAFIVSLVWFLVASSEPWGFSILDSTVNGTTTRVGMSTVRYFIEGSVKVGLSPSLFPISYAAGANIQTSEFKYETSKAYSEWREETPEYGVYVTRSVQGIVYGEMAKNVILFFLGSLLTVHLLDKILPWKNTNHYTPDER